MSLNASCAPIRVRFGRRSIVGLTTIALLAGLVGTVTPARAQTTVLHDQYNNSAQTTTNSQNYDTVSDTYDNEAADDFEVPAGATWTIATVEVAGQYHSPNDRPSSVNVRIYRDATGLPGTSVEEWPNLQPTGGFGSPNFSNFSIPLPDAPPLGAGRYWISVQVNLVSGQHWFWRNRSATTLNPAAWRNPGGAWETPCENWGQRAATCAPSGDLAATDPDQVFRLLGASGGNQTGGPSTARNIQLCQGDVAGPGTACDTSDAFNEPGTEHEFTARVTDRRGDPVANVPVEFRETGPGVFTPQGGSTATVTTDANGLAAVILTSDVAGESSVVAEIDAGDPPTFREPGVDDDECEQPSDTDGNPSAGNCISQTLIKRWQPDPPSPACDDGLDNDQDRLIDTEDPGCNSPEDNSEEPINDPDPKQIRHERSISIRFNDGTGARSDELVVFGRLRAPDYPDCHAGQPVKVQRFKSGQWITKKSTTTNRRGRYAVEIFDLASRYRVVAARTEIDDVDRNEVHVCVQALKTRRHVH